MLRHYIEDRFGLRAPEQTTEEFLAELRQKHVFGERQKDLLRAFLEHCDLVKFAELQTEPRGGGSHCGRLPAVHCGDEAGGSEHARDRRLDVEERDGDSVGAGATRSRCLPMFAPLLVSRVIHLTVHELCSLLLHGCFFCSQ